MTACLAVAGAAVLAASSGATGPGAKTAVPKAQTRVSIFTYPGGVFGFVSSPRPQRCAAHRSLVVFERRGRGLHPRRDRRLAGVRAKRVHGRFEWSLKTGDGGAFYARAENVPGCRLGGSPAAAPGPGGPGGGATISALPQCSPYVGEGPTTACRLDIRLRVKNGGGGWETGNGRATGEAKGTFPWGQTAYRDDTSGLFGWRGVQDRTVTYASSGLRMEEEVGHQGAFLLGTEPGPRSAAYSIQDGFAQNEGRRGDGEHFYTPDIPGQDPGERGGPLYLDFSTSSIKIYGFLYLKPQR